MHPAASASFRPTIARRIFLRNWFAPLWRFAAATALLLPVCVAAAPEAGMQCEGKASYYFIEPLRYVAPSGSDGLLYTTATSATITPVERFTLLFDHRLRTVSSHTLFPEQTYPFENYLYGGFALDGPGSLTLGASNSFFRNVRSFPAPWYLSTVQISPRTLGQIDGDWKLETERVTLGAAATYSTQTFNMKPADIFEWADRGSGPYGMQRDNDLWADVTAALLLNDDISIITDGLTKQDFNGFDGYNLYRTRLGVAGNHAFNRNRVKFEWEAAERLMQSPVMKGNGYATGFATMLSTRCMWRISSNFFIKGAARAELGARLHRLFLEAQLRRTWDNGSNIDLIYFSTAGSLFPRQGLRFAHKTVLHPHFAFGGYLEGYLSRLVGSEYRYYRSDVGLELLFPVISRIEFFLGGAYRHYDRHPLYASRAMVCAGIRSW